jgi:hypothetical protein
LLEEKVVIFLGVGLYLAVLIFVLISEAKNISSLLAARKRITQLGTIGSFFLLIALLLRFIFLIVLPFGGFETVRYSDVVFSELPALIYLTCFAIVVYQWVFLYHNNIRGGAGNSHIQLKFVFIGFISLLFLVFSLIVIIFSLVDAPTSNRCYTVVEDYGPARIVAILYKAFFALVCTGLAITFAVYGYRVTRVSNSFKVVPLNLDEQNLIKQKKTEVKRVSATSSF